MGGSDNKGDGLASQPRRYRVPGQPLLNRHQVGGVSRSPDGLFAQQEREPIRGRPTVRGKRTYGGRPGQRVEEQGTWAAQKHSEAGYGRPVDRGVWTAKTVKRPQQQPAHPQYANYWAPLTRKRHTMPHSAQSQHANYWAPRTRKRHQQEHRPQRPTESSDPTQHAKGRTGDRPGPRKGATTRRNVTQGVGRGMCGMCLCRACGVYPSLCDSGPRWSGVYLDRPAVRALSPLSEKYRPCVSVLHDILPLPGAGLGEPTAVDGRQPTSAVNRRRLAHDRQQPPVGWRSAEVRAYRRPALISGGGSLRTALRCPQLWLRSTVGRGGTGMGLVGMRAGRRSHQERRLRGLFGRRHVIQEVFASGVRLYWQPPEPWVSMDLHPAPLLLVRGPSFFPPAHFSKQRSALRERPNQQLHCLHMT